MNFIIYLTANERKAVGRPTGHAKPWGTIRNCVTQGLFQRAEFPPYWRFIFQFPSFSVPDARTLLIQDSALAAYRLVCRVMAELIR